MTEANRKGNTVPFQIYHFRAGALKGQVFQADDERGALDAWQESRGQQATTTTRADGKPCVRYGFADVVLHEYVAVAVR